MTRQYVKHRALNRASRLLSHIVSHHCGVHCSSSGSFLQLVLQERIETGETYKPTFVYMGVCMFVCLGIRVFQDFFIAGVSLLMCSYLQGAVRYWQQSLGPDFVYLLYRHFFHLCFCRFVFFCAVLCREGGALAAPGDILAGICLPLGEKYPNTANNLKEM